VTERDDKAESRLESALAAALRDGVSGDGPDDLRRRVMVRIALPSMRLPLRARPALAWAACLAVVAASLLFFSTRRQTESGSGAPAARSLPPASTAAGVEASDRERPNDVSVRVESAEIPPGSTAQRAAHRGHEGLRAEGGATSQEIELPGSLTALPPPEPLEPAPLGAERLALRRLVIPGLEVPRLAIEPLERERS
jgi:hypothetical protein